MDYIYEAVIEPDPDGGLLVSFPDVPEALTHGKDHADARTSASEALGLALRGYLAERRPLPPARATGTPIAVGPGDALKLALIEAFEASGISKSELARRLGKAETEARRLLEPDYPSKLASMQAALAVLGKTVVVSVRDAA